MRCLALSLAAICCTCVIARAADRDEEWIKRQIAQLRPAAPLEAWIAWTSSLLEARRLSQNEHRPVFLFSFEGNLFTGRC
jgi:hypothetical protein